MTTPSTGAPRSEQFWLSLYHIRGRFPLRQSTQARIDCWHRYGNGPVARVNTAYAKPEDFDHIQPSVIHIDTSFLSRRWSDPDAFATDAWAQSLRDSQALILFQPQDEFVDTVKLNDFIDFVGGGIVLSCAEGDDLERIYPNADARGLTFMTVLPGYLPLDSLSGTPRPIRQRPIDLGYRAWDAGFWIGRKGLEKTAAAKAVRSQEPIRLPSGRPARTDISLNEADVLKGQSWQSFLERCKAVLGAESGASVLDRDGAIRDRCIAFMADHPDSDFETVEKACFPDQDGSLSLFCLSPRHLEAAMTGTCQMLIRGHYSGVLRPDIDYIAISPDLSDLGHALEQLDNSEALQAVADSARARCLSLPHLRYDHFVATVEAHLSDKAKAASPDARAIATRLMRRDRFNWRRLAFEVWLGQHPRLRAILSPLRQASIRIARQLTGKAA